MESKIYTNSSIYMIRRLYKFEKKSTNKSEKILKVSKIIIISKSP